jgi:hypothetical protein
VTWLPFLIVEAANDAARLVIENLEHQIESIWIWDRDVIINVEEMACSKVEAITSEHGPGLPDIEAVSFPKIDPFERVM